jgi:hypothetical protein
MNMTNAVDHGYEAQKGLRSLISIVLYYCTFLSANFYRTKISLMFVTTSFTSEDTSSPPRLGVVLNFNVVILIVFDISVVILVDCTTASSSSSLLTSVAIALGVTL